MHSVHLGRWGVSHKALSDFAACVAVLLDGHIDLFPEEVVEALGLHFCQFLILGEVVLVVKPVAFVVVLPAQLLAVDREQGPAADIAQSRLLHHVEIGVFDRDALGLQRGDYRVAQRHLAQCLSRAENGPFAYCLYQEVDAERIDALRRIPHEVFEELLAIAVSFLRARLHLPPHLAFLRKLDLFLQGQFSFSDHVHVVRRCPFLHEHFSWSQDAEFRLLAYLVELLEGELVEEGDAEQFVAYVVPSSGLVALPGLFDPDVVHLEQFDPVDCLELGLALVEVEDQPVADREVDEALLVDRVYLLLDLAFAEDYDDRVRLHDFPQVLGDGRAGLVLNVLQRRYFLDGVEVEGVKFVEDGECLLVSDLVLEGEQVLELQGHLFILNRDGGVHAGAYNFIMQLENQTMGTPSPSKRSTFRSKTKLKDLASTMESKLRSMPLFYVYIKDFPLDIPEDVIALVKTLEPAHNNFLEHLENLKLYKPQLSSLLEDSWAESMQILRAVIVKLSKRSDKVIEEKEHKISELLRMNRELEKEQQRWSERVDKLEHLRELESVQLNMADTELEIVNGEMRDIYKLLQGDMQKVSSYLTKLEARKAQEDEEGSDQINGSIKTLSILLNNMENEQRSASHSLGNMRELIKSMTKCSKVTTGTQVDESELLTQAGAIFSTSSTDLLPFQEADASAVNVGSSAQSHLIDQLKLKERSQPHQNFSQAKHADKPWALTPTLLAFLENMSKDNEAGKVLPWQYTKQLMADIFAQRNALEAELTAGGIGNGMLFDEFVVFYFLQKHRIRRLAEVKLLEFMISLKYYSRYWQRAELFCQLMEVMRYQPLFENPDGFNYRLDYNAQNFFFSIHRKLATFECVEEEGATYVEKKSAKKLLKICLYFTEEYQRSRLLAKLDKDLRVFDKVEYCDFDWAMALMLDEYLASKKRITGTLNRAFSRKYQENQGFFSMDEVKDLFTEITPIYRAGESLQYGFPIASELQIGKLYLYACTSGKNTYELNVNNFIAACQRYGFDAPFPFLHNCRKKQREEPEEERVVESAKSTTTRREVVPVVQNEEISLTLSLDQPKVGEASLNKERIDIGAKIFSQHFSILRQLKLYVDIFSKTLRQEKNGQVLWRSFQQVRQVLQKGCEFMRYPLHDSRQ